MFRIIVIRALALLVAPLCLFTAWITGMTETYPENLTEPVSSQNFGLFEAIPRYQGLTTDGEAWYYSWNLGLIKTGMDHKIEALNFIAIPLKYLLQGNNHIGGISYWDGKVYCPLEDSAEYLRPYILVYDAETLRFTGEVYELPQELHVDGVSFVAVDGLRGVAYTAEWSNAAVLNIFRLEDFTLKETVTLSAPLDRIQDAEVYDGVLYCASDNGAEKSILAVDPVTGEVTHLFDRNLGRDIEAEGFTVLPMADGSFFHCTAIGSIPVNVVFSHYAMP